MMYGSPSPETVHCAVAWYISAFARRMNTTHDKRRRSGIQRDDREEVTVLVAKADEKSAVLTGDSVVAGGERHGG